jgi:alcohol dehydrogenase class IV
LCVMDAKLSYDFLAPQRIVFGWGRRRELGPLSKTLGRRAFLVSGLPAGIAAGVLDEIMAALKAEGIASVPLATLVHEPEVADVDRTAGVIRQHGAGEGDFLLAVGGGAAIDLAKATAAMATNQQSPTVKDYLENVGRDLKITRPPLPVLAMPSTAGTGAEATRNAVISSYDPPFKKSLRDNGLMPRLALVDPELTVTVPPSVTAASGMDAITQLIESYVSRKSQPVPRALCMQGLKMAVPAIVESVSNGSSRPAREAMSHAALLSGMALANSGLGMAHGVAAALGTHCRVPHGAACALLLPAAIRTNMELCQADFARLGHLLFGGGLKQPAETAERFLREIETLCDRVGVPRRLGQVGVTREQIPAIVRDSRGSSMSGNPRELSDAELTAILEGLL